MSNSAKLHPLSALISTALLITAPALHAQSAGRAKPPSSPPASQAQVDALRRQLSDQAEQLDNMRKALGDLDGRYRELMQAMEAEKKAHEDALSRMAQPQQAQSQQAQPPGAPRTVQVPPREEPREVQIGTAPAAVPESPLSVPQLFDQPSVLTARGQTIVEPSFQYEHSSTNRAALVGFTVIPAILVGLVDVREVRRNTSTATLTVRHGFSDRFELEGRLPYLYRSDSTVSREIFTGTATDRAFSATGSGIGDVEMTGRYQLTTGTSRWPYLIGSLRFKSRTGKDPFEVTTDCVTRCVGGTTGTGEPLELPVGSGFYTLQPGITWLYPSDPAVFFGSFTYGYNFKRTGVSRHVLGGETESLGDVKPGNTLGVNFGMGLALNDRSSFSIGVDLSTIGRTQQNGADVPGSVRTTLASLLLGYSLRWDQNHTVNLSVGAGLTRDTPDLTLTVRMPFNF
ncbi:acetate kinase [Ramlibacter ginsenosidimutans]|uniref:Acetate kinase n=1 Tax=Ramlibacter ginsenosidimutans TaxID=502333 RepID=A0A934TRT6_9BURK|nr:acetate kinase [Ramlibacter ginsenosidimutans]MBK6006401.1 acetate kinase [Ramlibacter ginsenosidimutans]